MTLDHAGVAEGTIKALPSLAGCRAELERLSRSLVGQNTPVAIGRYVAGVVDLLYRLGREDPAPSPDAKGWGP